MSETQAEKLNRLTERIWVYPFEEERDRPNLGYIRGDRWSLAVDAGVGVAVLGALAIVVIRYLKKKKQGAYN